MYTVIILDIHGNERHVNFDNYRDAMCVATNFDKVKFSKVYLNDTLIHKIKY